MRSVTPSHGPQLVTRGSVVPVETGSSHHAARKPVIAGLVAAPRDDERMRLLGRERAQETTRPHLRPIPAWSWMIAAVISVAVTALVVTIWLLAIAGHAKGATDQANARLDAVRTGLAAGAGAGAAVGLMLAFRRQHHQEIATAQTDEDATERRITELYTKAVEQLGSDKAPVRLGGLYALERLAQGNQAQRKTIVNVICAYLRMPFPPQPPASRPAPADAENAAAADLETLANRSAGDDTWQQEEQVRRTAQRILTDHLRKPDDNQQPVDRPTAPFWDQINVDLTGATLIDFDLAHCKVTGEARFAGATFTGDARFDGATFTHGARFDGATFTRGALFGGAIFTGDAWFSGAIFTRDAWFSRATFTHGALFRRATFAGGAGFDGATFKRGADALDFSGVHVRPSDSSYVWPAGWQGGVDSQGELTVVRAAGT
jgi:hypothetical protein